MAEYLIVDDAQERSRLEAMQRAAGLQQGAVTEYWHSWIEHPLTGQQALVVNNDADKEYFTVGEISALLTQQQAEDTDWFLSFDQGE